MSDDRATLIDIANACRRVSVFMEGNDRPGFLSDLKTQSAVLHQLLVLGEAVRRLTPEFRMAHPDIDWQGYAGLRNVLIHQYHNVDLHQVWKIAQEDVPELSRQVDALLTNHMS